MPESATKKKSIFSRLFRNTQSSSVAAPAPAPMPVQQPQRQNLIGRHRENAAPAPAPMQRQNLIGRHRENAVPASAPIPVQQPQHQENPAPAPAPMPVQQPQHQENPAPAHAPQQAQTRWARPLPNAFFGPRRNAEREKAMEKGITLGSGRDLKNKLISMQRAILSSEQLKKNPVVRQFESSEPIQRLFTLVDDYSGTVSSAAVPAMQNNPNFLKELSQINARVMASHGRLLEYCTQMSTDQQNPMLAAFFGSLLVKVDMQQNQLNSIVDSALYGYRHGDFRMAGQSYPQIMASTSLFRFDSSQATALGSGGINTVYRVEADGRSRVFKHGKRDIVTAKWTDPELNVVQDRLGYKAHQYDGIHEAPSHPSRPVESMINEGFEVNEFKSTNRDVAMSRLDKLLGLNVCTETSMAFSESGSVSTLMDMARGDKAEEVNFYTDESNKQMAFMFRDFKCVLERIKSSATVDQNSHEIQKIQNQKVLNLYNPNLISKIMKMQILDIVGGFVDRHVGNYMIDEEGNLTAIDNDMAFQKKTMAERSNDYYSNVPSLDFSANFPFVTPEIKAIVSGIDADIIADALQGMVGPEEIGFVRTRIKELKEYIGKAPVENLTPENMQRLIPLIDPNITDTFKRRDEAEKSYARNLTKHIYQNIESLVSSLITSENAQNYFGKFYILADIPAGDIYSANDFGPDQKKEIFVDAVKEMCYDFKEQRGRMAGYHSMFDYVNEHNGLNDYIRDAILRYRNSHPQKAAENPAAAPAAVPAAPPADNGGAV